MYCWLCCTSRVPLSPGGSAKLVPCWILAREMGSVTVTPGHRVLPLVLPAQLLFQQIWDPPFGASQAKFAGTFCYGHAPLVLLLCVSCLSFHPLCAGPGAVLDHSFPWEGLCPPWALPEISPPAGDLKHHLRMQPSTGLGVMVQAGSCFGWEMWPQ